MNQEELSRLIFSERFDTLDRDRQEFVVLQVKVYGSYRRLVRREILAAENKQRLSSYESKLIHSWFIDRIPLDCVVQGIREGVNQVAGYNKTIWSAGFFRPYIQIYHQRYKRDYLAGMRHNIPETCNDPWLFCWFKASRNGSLGHKFKFDPWRGIRYS
jgi:hypothetical protein